MSKPGQSWVSKLILNIIHISIPISTCIVYMYISLAIFLSVVPWLSISKHRSIKAGVLGCLKFAWITAYRPSFIAYHEIIHDQGLCRAYKKVKFQWIQTIKRLRKISENNIIIIIFSIGQKSDIRNVLMIQWHMPF